MIDSPINNVSILRKTFLPKDMIFKNYYFNIIHRLYCLDA